MKAVIQRVKKAKITINNSQEKSIGKGIVIFIGIGEDAKVELMTLAFSGLLCGLYITPVHLCLALSSSYFKAPLTKIIPILLGPVFFIAAAGITMALFIR